ncbi:MAG TPA: hypothetical protein VKO35_06185, partial [Acidimicrobiia bacterium]|nr:hypothetical protein [Acidimicrobiia bacterium]
PTDFTWREHTGGTPEAPLKAPGQWRARVAPQGAGSRKETDVLEITDDAAAVLERAYDAAGRFNPGVKIRVYRAGDEVQFGFAERPSEGDDVVPVGDMLIFVEGGISGTLEAQQPHDRLVVRQDG